MKIPALYIVGAVVFGLICAYGMMALTYHPQPVQVQVNQYQPIRPVPTFAPVQAPQPAITTVPVPTSTGAFDPAPAPVVVTTMPLPQITPTPVISIPYKRTEPYISACGNVQASMANAMSFVSLLGNLLMAASVFMMLMSIFTRSGVIQAVMLLIMTATFMFVFPEVMAGLIMSMPC